MNHLHVYILDPRYWGAGPRAYDHGRTISMCIFWVHVTGGRARARMTMDEPFVCVYFGWVVLGGWLHLLTWAAWAPQKDGFCSTSPCVSYLLGYVSLVLGNLCAAIASPIVIFGRVQNHWISFLAPQFRFQDTSKSCEEAWRHTAQGHCIHN